jgi:hypothetical protein
MKIFLIILFCFSFRVNTVGQCDIKKWSENNITIIGHEQESIYNHADDRGGIAAYFEFVLRKDNETQKSISSILIEVSVVGSYEMIVPRSFKVTFTDLSIIELEAYSLLSPSYKNGLTSQKGLYPIKDDELKQLGSKSIKEILIMDKRQNKGIPCNPYKDLVSEQIKCVFKNL